ncbi:MAG: methionine synthase [Methermicoccaceae archaeon]
MDDVDIPILDDIGSFPPPDGMDRAQLLHMAETDRESYLSVVVQSMRTKLSCGIDVTTYPQFRDMNAMFTDLILDETLCDEPFRIKPSNATILELEALDVVAKEFKKEQGEKLPVRVCVTGPIELYLSIFGGSAYTDILLNLALSVRRFLRRSISGSYVVKVVSIDEPSLGLNPSILFSEDDMLEALDISASVPVETQIHLHSQLYMEMACASCIDVVGIEAASDPSVLELIDRRFLESTDTFLRVGIARTDIHSMVAELNARYDVNAWTQPELLQHLVSEMETPETIGSRLRKAHSLFGDRLRYAGPDCGLGSWPSQKLACMLLENVRRARDTFYTV